MVVSIILIMVIKVVVSCFCGVRTALFAESQKIPVFNFGVMIGSQSICLF